MCTVNNSIDVFLSWKPAVSGWSSLSKENSQQCLENLSTFVCWLPWTSVWGGQMPPGYLGIFIFHPFGWWFVTKGIPFPEQILSPMSQPDISSQWQCQCFLGNSLPLKYKIAYSCLRFFCLKQIVQRETQWLFESRCSVIMPFYYCEGHLASSLI